MDIALTDKDIATICRRIHANANIIFLPKMGPINSLEEVFKGTDHAIIFVATNGEYSGHWQALFKTTNNIYFFDSYGHNFTILLRKVFRNFGKDAYNESFKLGQIIANSDYFKNGHVIMNTKRYQTIAPDINTCGRHVCVCFKFFKEQGNSFNFFNYSKFMNSYKKEHGFKNYDEMVVAITNEIIRPD